MAATGREIWLYLVAVTTLSAVAIGLLYGVFAAGLTDGIESFLANPQGAVWENPLGVLALAGVFLVLLALFAAVVVGGARYADLDADES